MNISEERFPFGAPSTRRPPRPPAEGRARIAIVGAYPSALHVRWDLPRWAVEEHGLAERVGALAVDVEPCVFWDGTAPHASQLVFDWKAAVGFREGDATDEHGHAYGHMNGTSGRAVAAHVLAPLDLTPAQAFFTDVLPRFFVKTGPPTRPQQADRIRDVYKPFAELTGLPPSLLPQRPSQARLVAQAIKEEGPRLRAELAETHAPTVVTLGEEARAVIAEIADEASGVPLGPLSRSDNYGRHGSVRICNYRASWYALTHPGNRSPAWATLHKLWVTLTAMERRED